MIKYNGTVIIFVNVITVKRILIASKNMSYIVDGDYK